MLDRRQLLTTTAALAGAAVVPRAALAQSGMRVRIIDARLVVVIDGTKSATLRIGDRFGDLTFLLAVGTDYAVLEDFTRIDGRIVIVGTAGVLHAFAKTAEPTTVDYAGGFLGHSREAVLAADRDLLGDAILASGGDPGYEAVAAVFPPIRKIGGDTYSFVGTPETQDKIWFLYGGRSPNFDPAVYHPAIDPIRAAGKVRDGLVGGDLPVLRFVYPESDDTWCELLAFAPFRIVNGNTRFQPVWYRVSRVEKGKLAWSRVFDSYHPAPPRTEDRPADFYADLVALRKGWDERLSGAMRVQLPDPRMANMARASLIRAMMTRSAGSPKYGVADKNYGNEEHDGFPDVFTVETGAMLEWGMVERAGQYLDNYFGEFVRDDGAILYRGPETGQFGRMLTVAAHYITSGGNPALLLKHRKRLDAVATLLLGLRDKAKALPIDSPAYGMIAGWSEADSVLEPNPERYIQPYFGNSAEAARGLRDLGRVWRTIGAARKDVTLDDWGNKLLAESEDLQRDLQKAIARSLLRVDGETVLPAIAGVREPFHVALARDRSDPQWRAYRAHMEAMHSGLLTTEQLDLIVDYRKRHHDVILGMPAAYGLATGELAGFLSYGHGYGLIQADRAREALLMTYSSMAHHYTRGMWLAPETRKPLEDTHAAPYCSPAQLVQPLMLKWLLVFHDPASDVLWLGKAMPADWLAERGRRVVVDAAPTRWGRIGYTLERLKGGVAAELRLPETGIPAVKLRLRGLAIAAVSLDGERLESFDPATATIDLPANVKGTVRLTVKA